MPQVTKVHEIKILHDGTIFVLLDFEITDAAGNVVGKRADGFHMMTFAPGQDLKQVRAAAEATVGAQGFPKVPDEDFDTIRTLAAKFQTPAKITAHKARQAEALARHLGRKP